MASAAAPGMVGSITSMSAAGVAMGVDTMRSAGGNVQRPGFNSIMLVRHIANHADNTTDALELIRTAQRGCPWFYPLCDASGHCVVVEALARMAEGGPADLNPLQYVNRNEKKLKVLLPTADFIRAHAGQGVQWLDGAFVRGTEYSYPIEYLAYNERLLALANMTYNASAFAPGGHLFRNFTDEHAVQKRLRDNYFPPPRTAPASDPNFVVVSNFALVPDIRITMMNDASDIMQALGGTAIQWRYDMLHGLVQDAAGSIDLESAKDIITFLAPDRTPGFWTNRLNPDDPMTAQIEGSITVADLVTREMHVKAGYFTDAWIGVHLLAYL